ncbi:FAD-binding oxidoreductase [Sulfitobacter sp. S223]|uniref:FAD-binding oxidoreductase n=1 Tax=Sulfitobacter sp. S223 TaxID=2867023 RepID=UPI0021A930C0|nr:FAD-binding oxidoreductase [Sulfitobacter sp. S223]UWR25083.1 FAD-binding oxidoreductase [Sulfitobacter sp. S223]
MSRRAALLGGGMVVGGVLTRSFSASNPTLDGTRSIQPAGAAGTLNDASELSETPIFKHIIVKDDPGEPLIASIRAELDDARTNNRPVNVGAARHSMGGQAIPRNGHAITFENDLVEVDTANQTMRVHAGARWRDVIATTDPIGFGPRVMQSNNDFGVAATFCVNAHGWPVKEGPMGSTVRAFDMILPDGSLVRCSRTENADLFGLTMGGYGLTGIITQMDVDLLPNQRLEPSFQEMPAEAFGESFMAALADETVKMAYGRLNVQRASFMADALLVTYRASTDQSDLPAASGSGVAAKLASRIYRGQLGNEWMKRLRWWFEADLATKLASGPVTRNSLINEPVVTLDDRNSHRVDILHEYFIAPARFAEFVAVCRAVIPGSYQEFLNVTLRFVDTDPDSWLGYATTPRIAAVMSFSQELTARAEADMQRMTQELIDGVIAIGGTYYLPYRPHARADQFARAYPRAPEFTAAKRALDRDLILRNNLWDSYLEAL